MIITSWIPTHLPTHKLCKQLLHLCWVPGSRPGSGDTTEDITELLPHKQGHLYRHGGFVAPSSVERSVTVVLKFLIIFLKGNPHFHSVGSCIDSVLGPACKNTERQKTGNFNMG